MESVELYLHIPFCIKKCAYCDFLSAPADDLTMEAYVRSLQAEILQKSAFYGKCSVPTVFFGGGTPSILPADLIADLMDTIDHCFSLDANAEISLEANPGTITLDKVKIYKAAGINRISMGLQSARNVELRMLGRIHSYEDFLKSYDIVRKAGIQNVNVDLMSGLPGQSIESWQKTLKSVATLRPEHISAYSLQIEEGTDFYDSYALDLEAREKGEEPELLPSEEADRAMYQMTKEMLDRAGYHRYEISNYAKEGKECRHNIGYWTGMPYLGLGLGASSYMKGERFKNVEKLEEYMKNAFPRKEVQVLSKKEKMEEFMFLGLRMKEGVTRSEFLHRFDTTIEAAYGDIIGKLCAAGVLAQEAGRIFLTDAGIDVSIPVLAEFLLGEDD